jgi:uncharacterized phage protein gp47/JayE
MSEIYSRLVDSTITNTTEINDFSVGSAMRAIYEAVAIELEQFYILTRENIVEAIEAGVYSSFGFTRKPAQRAYGTVRVTFHNTTQQVLPLSRGTKFTSNLAEYPQTYETVEDYYIPSGSLTADIEVYCTTPGALGNVPANVINVMMTPLANIKSVANPSAFQTGQDTEPLEEMRARFRTYIEALSRATVPALEYGTRSVIEVSGVYVDEKTGLVTIYAHDRNGNLPELVKAKIETEILKYKPAGIPVEVKPVTRKSIDLDVVITLTTKTAITNAFRQRITEEIERYLNNMQSGQSLIKSDLTSVIKYIDRKLIYDVTFTNLSGNIDIAGHEVVRAGTVTVTLK